MRWNVVNLKEWHRRFAWLPVCIGGQGIWLEPYEARLLYRDLVDEWEYRLPRSERA